MQPFAAHLDGGALAVPQPAQGVLGPVDLLLDLLEFVDLARCQLAPRLVYRGAGTQPREQAAKFLDRKAGAATGGDDRQTFDCCPIVAALAGDAGDGSQQADLLVVAQCRGSQPELASDLRDRRGPSRLGAHGVTMVLPELRKRLRSSELEGVTSRP
jgi:hypothetical protein